MARLRAATTNTDSRRCVRAMLAWMDGDKLALDVVLQELIDDPTGVPGIMFEVIEFAVFVGLKADPDLGDHLREFLLDQEKDS